MLCQRDDSEFTSVWLWIVDANRNPIFQFVSKDHEDGRQQHINVRQFALANLFAQHLTHHFTSELLGSDANARAAG